MSDSTSGLPVAKQLSLSYQAQKEILLSLSSKAEDRLPGSNLEAVLTGAGYDVYPVYELIVNQLDAEPIT